MSLIKLCGSSRSNNGTHSTGGGCTRLLVVSSGYLEASHTVTPTHDCLAEEVDWKDEFSNERIRSKLNVCAYSYWFRVNGMAGLRHFLKHNKMIKQEWRTYFCKTKTYLDFCKVTHTITDFICILDGVPVPERVKAATCQMIIYNF